ncbi:MAG: polymer-forming cytoskeletal protein [Burkholderiales bacterium]|jgi:cytoskeletal protein CcmA (bactofilin family)|nr:polymer-forming cytoskeletal protein [Burkholderiales bacterium]
MFSSKRNGQGQIGSLIGAGTTVRGDMTFTGGLRIDGTVLGSVRCTDSDKGGMLVISETGAIEGEVRACHMVVAGRITGPVTASELLELQPKARVHGDVRYRALEMHHGAIVEGSLSHEASIVESTNRPTTLKLAAAAPRSEVEASSEQKTGTTAG